MSGSRAAPLLLALPLAAALRAAPAGGDPALRGDPTPLGLRSLESALSSGQFKEEGPEEFEWSSRGPNTACRLGGRDSSKQALGSARATSARDQADCKRQCEAIRCRGIEWSSKTGRCELWTEPITTTAFAVGFECLTVERTVAWRVWGWNTACRLGSWDRSSDGYSSAKVVPALDLAECKRLCEDSECRGVEWNARYDTCEVWTQPIQFLDHASDSVCLTVGRAAEPRARVSAPPMLEQRGALVEPGEEIRTLTVGSSNVVYGTWLDQLGMMLRQLGFRTSAARPGDEQVVLAPGRNVPQCDDRVSWAGAIMPRFGKPGWSSWGFAYESKDDCIGGYRNIAGTWVSCANSVGCTSGLLVKPSSVAEAAKDAHVVILSNWINDMAHGLSRNKCFAWQDRSTKSVVEVAFAGISRLVAAIRLRNPGVPVLVMGVYPRRDRNDHVNATRVPIYDYANGLMRRKLATLQGVALIDYKYPLGVELYQMRHRSHPNCRADRIMAKRALQVLYEQRIIARSFEVGSPHQCPGGASASNCEALSLPCCQLAAMCTVGRSGVCVPYSPGW